MSIGKDLYQANYLQITGVALNIWSRWDQVRPSSLTPTSREISLVVKKLLE